jgi:hypothetical protein
LKIQKNFGASCIHAVPIAEAKISFFHCQRTVTDYCFWQQRPSAGLQFHLPTAHETLMAGNVAYMSGYQPTQASKCILRQCD